MFVDKVGVFIGPRLDHPRAVAAFSPSAPFRKPSAHSHEHLNQDSTDQAKK
jgi:hypothetical protein